MQKVHDQEARQALLDALKQVCLVVCGWRIAYIMRMCGAVYTSVGVFVSALCIVFVCSCILCVCTITDVSFSVKERQRGDYVVRRL